MKIRNLVAPCLAAVLWTLPAHSDQEGAGDAALTLDDAEAKEEAALDVARAYLEGISGGDLDQLDLLFVADGGSTVFENASNEGSWEHYKEHHLAPEQEAVQNFRFTSEEEVAEACGDGFLVRHVGGFSLDVEGQTRNYRAAVTFVIVPSDSGPRILHLHWSSRQKR